ncbi:hypothetical protein FNF29_04938 [Cafeteria roenbergensis]|uniref:Uncharacterized protein n=1 Tax=Cafeteria roenbergensis TaxID=33653 RepID=A0A5A8CE30_CAFRO|nr:hypothetical protein FNF29_04938 [Cafeteria roenbergensis]|eukprot:KAA0150824.1 hypothetical protein FNF29_04938 [Cafeteria roenbergensis]
MDRTAASRASLEGVPSFMTMGLGLDRTQPRTGGVTVGHGATNQLVMFDKPLHRASKPSDDLAFSMASRRMGESLAAATSAAAAAGETTTGRAAAAAAAGSPVLRTVGAASLGLTGDMAHMAAAAVGGTATVPDHVRLTGQVLSFRGYFKEAVTESRFETFRRRVVLLRYFLEDDTFEIFETRARNDGMSGSKFLNRQQNDAVTIESLRVGSNITVYSRSFHLTACDEHTRSFFDERGEPQPPDEDIPDDAFTATTTAQMAATSGWNGKRTQAISRYVEAVRGKVVKKQDTLARFLEHDGNVLRFSVLWDGAKTRGDPLAVRQRLSLVYYLTDGTVEVLRLKPPGANRQSLPAKFLLRARLPRKIIIHDDRARSCEDGTGDEDYFNETDFRVGDTITVHSMPMLIYDCDGPTHRWYMDNYGIDQKSGAVDISEAAKPKPTLPVPPHHGFGSEEDTLHSVKYLDPQSHPRKGDYKRFLQSKGKTLKFFATLDGEDPIDTMRRYRISWYLDDDTLAVYEQKVRNSGIAPGKWQARTKMVNPATGENFKSSDFFVGARVTIKGHKFCIQEADDFSYSYMEDLASLWPMSSVEFVFAKLKAKLLEKSASLRELFRRYDTDKSQSISLSEFVRMLESFGIGLAKQECVTVFRAFDTSGEGLIDYNEFLSVFEGTDAVGGVLAEASGLHADRMAAAAASGADPAAFMAMAERQAARESTEAATERLVTSIAQSMKRSRQLHAIHDSFRKLDSNKDNTVDKREFTTAMGRFGFHLDPREIELLSTRFFPDGAQTMDYEHFVGIMREYGEKPRVRG